MKDTKYEIGTIDCPIVAFNELTMGKYKIRILWEARSRPRRYSEIRRALVDATGGRPVTPRVLSRELRELESSGLLHRRQYLEVPPRVEYSLTKEGKRLLPIMKAICRWGTT